MVPDKGGFSQYLSYGSIGGISNETSSKRCLDSHLEQPRPQDRQQGIGITGMHFCLMCNTALNLCYCRDKICNI